MSDCGATRTFCDSVEDLRQQGLPEVWAGVTVTCDSWPHTCAEEDVVHAGSILLDGEIKGRHF